MKQLLLCLATIALAYSAVASPRTTQDDSACNEYKLDILHVRTQILGDVKLVTLVSTESEIEAKIRQLKHTIRRARAIPRLFPYMCSEVAEIGRSLHVPTRIKDEVEQSLARAKTKNQTLLDAIEVDAELKTIEEFIESFQNRAKS